MTTWTGATIGTSYWDAAGNWSTGAVPGSASNLSILGTGPFTILLGNTDPAYTIRSLALGAAGSNVTLQVAGRLSVASAITVASGSALDIGATGSVGGSSLDLTGATIIDRGSLDITGTASGSGTVDVQGGSLFINTIAGINTYDLTGSGSMTISDSSGGSGAIVFGDTSPITLNLSGAGSVFGASITGFGAADTIDIGSLAWSKGETVSVNGTTLTITGTGTGAGKTLFTFSDFNTPGHVRLESDGNGGTELYTCFVAGTRIQGEFGEVAVEDLEVGDIVATLEDGAIVHRPVRWIGSRHLDKAILRRSGGHPVRLRAGAVSQAVPHRDLLVTPEHCVLIEGQLVPARMLVNGRSIFVDRSVGAFTFHHVELERHGILIAEGLFTESYLDTGNRRSFTGPPGCDPAQDSWQQAACAPLLTDRAILEPLWRRLDRRAATIGWPDQRPALALTRDPRLRLQLEGGQQISARWDDGGRHIFHIPVGTRPVQLLSRVAVPAIVIGPFVDDRRELGVQVSTVIYWEGLHDTVIRAADLDLEGWHAAESDLRWTAGAAHLDLPTATRPDTFVEIRIVDTLPYRKPLAFSRLAA